MGYERKQGRLESTKENPEKELILAKPSYVGCAGSLSAIGGSGGRWRRKGTIHEAKEIMADENGVKLQFPREIILWSKLD